MSCSHSALAPAVTLVHHVWFAPLQNMISEHATEWLGYPVKLFNAETSEQGINDYAGTIYRLALDWDAEVDFPELFSRFIANPESVKTPAIIIGQYHGDDPSLGSEEVVQLLVSARSKLPNLRGVFITDVVTEENEVSWIVQSDISPLLMSYPELEHLRLRGTGELTFGGRISHQNLRSLTIETGGLPPQLLREVLASQLPSLDTLELWLGTPSYGGDVTVADLQPLLSDKLFPKLKRLGLRDSEIVDEIASALQSAPVLARLEGLDLSLGVLSDKGGKALLENSALKQLKQLDLHRHFLSDSMMTSLKRAFPVVNVDDAQGSKTAEDDRFVALGE